MSSFYTEEELKEIGFKSFGKNVLISKKASIYGAHNMTIGNNVRVDDFCILSGKITFGDYIHISAYTSLFAGDVGIELEDFATISSRCVIYAITDDYSGDFMTNPMIDDKYRNVIGSKIIIKKHSIIGSGSTIIPNGKNELIIEEGTSIGAMSLVKKNTLAWNIYCGIPAKPIKERNKNILELEKQFLREIRDE